MLFSVTGLICSNCRLLFSNHVLSISFLLLFQYLLQLVYLYFELFDLNIFVFDELVLLKCLFLLLFLLTLLSIGQNVTKSSKFLLFFFAKLLPLCLLIVFQLLYLSCQFTVSKPLHFVLKTPLYRLTRAIRENIAAGCCWVILDV